MCGICAIVGEHGDAQSSAIQAMVAALRHRGPDRQSVKRLAGCELGHARLSIIDLEGGSQPMSDSSGRYWIVFNGEIYNFREIRALLERRGHRFHTQSDTEVILGAYAEWGADCLQRLRGMFAFIIWDERERRLFAARDLFGEKPLYYAKADDGAWLFASELRALLASGKLTPRLDPAALDAYLCFGYVPPTATIYRNVHAVPPAHYIEWQAGAAMQPMCYWHPVFEQRSIDAGEAAERLRALLQQAVQRQMVADVPVGAFLSGGHDSSTVVALMQSLTDKPVKTFSVGFGKLIDERPYARLVAQKYGTEHHEIDLGAPPVAELLERMADVYDEPFMDPSHVPTYLISEFARRHVKVVLSGDGADELFGGYAWYPLLARSTELSGAWPLWFASRAVSRLIGDRFRPLSQYSRAQALARRDADPWSRYVDYKHTFNGAQRKKLLGDTAVAEPMINRARPNGTAYGFDRVLHFDLSVFLPGDILVKVDRAAMAHGLETRAPFLDRDLAEFALSLPSTFKVSHGETKVLFKQALAQYWPDELRRRGKQGFAAPYAAWLARPDVRALLARVCAKGSPLRHVLPGLPHEAPNDRSYRTWSILTLGLWMERHAV